MFKAVDVRLPTVVMSFTGADAPCGHPVMSCAPGFTYTVFPATATLVITKCTVCSEMYEIRAMRSVGEAGGLVPIVMRRKSRDLRARWTTIMQEVSAG